MLEKEKTFRSVDVIYKQGARVQWIQHGLLFFKDYSKGDFNSACVLSIVVAPVWGLWALRGLALFLLKTFDFNFFVFQALLKRIWGSILW